MFRLRSLKVGTIIGTGAIIGILLTLAVLPISGWAALLLLPYVIWSRWNLHHLEMMRLNLVMYNSLHLSMPLGTVSKPNRAIAERISVDRNC